MEDRCVCCGEIIPEGRMVCPMCEYKVMNNLVPNVITVKCPKRKQPKYVGAETLNPHATIDNKPQGLLYKYFNF